MRRIWLLALSTRRRTPHWVQQPRQDEGLTTWPGWVLSWPVAGSMRNSGVNELPRVALAVLVPEVPATRPLAPRARVSP